MRGLCSGKGKERAGQGGIGDSQGLGIWGFAPALLLLDKLLPSGTTTCTLETPGNEERAVVTRALRPPESSPTFRNRRVGRMIIIAATLH